MRENASQLVQLIPKDCPGLTVHDVTHLDALWETADLIAGPDFSINPAEAFVFGAAILLHDSAMSVAAFPGGLSAISQTLEWKDAVFAAFQTRGEPPPNDDSVANPPEEIREEILFSVLRALHARQAENLISISWESGTNGEKLKLLDDVKLRNAYGKSIGRIAHSHHWEIERLSVELREDAGIATALPNPWTLNEIKVACLLRCADAAHIDDRRAPSMLFALTKPTGISEQHWRFQNKLNKPVFKSDSLCYSSGQDFEIDDTSAWWMCFDFIGLIDRELSSSNALLQDINASKFAAGRVFGAENPLILAKQIRPKGWRPVNAEIRVSNPISVAETLGGRNLYGRSAFAPIRELIQNAVDAVRARRGLEERSVDWGQIRVLLEADCENGPRAARLHIDDNGVGMSERVMVGPLIDFGKSLWNSSLLHDELPGLQSRSFRAAGKFGIGFFSVFLLGKNVSVISRRYSSGLDDARVLEFSSIDNRPILRNAKKGELPNDFCTRISVRIEDIDELSEDASSSLLRARRRGKSSEQVTVHDILVTRVRQLIAALDINVEIEDKIAGSSYSHGSDWQNVSVDRFLDELLSGLPEEQSARLIAMHQNQLECVVDTNGSVLGRSALYVGNRGLYRSDFAVGLNHVSVGGLIYPSMGFTNFDYLGVMNGNTEVATRHHAFPEIQDEVLVDWSTIQAERMDLSKFSVPRLMDVCHQIMRLYGDPGNLPFCFAGDSFLTLSEFRTLAESSKKLHFPIYKSYDDAFYLHRSSKLTTKFFVPGAISESIVVNTEDERNIFDGDKSKNIIEDAPLFVEREELEEQLDNTGLQLLFEELDMIWECDWVMVVERRQIFKGDYYEKFKDNWVLTLNRENS